MSTSDIYIKRPLHIRVLQVPQLCFSITLIALSAILDARTKKYNDSHPGQPEIVRWAFIASLTFANVTTSTVLTEAAFCTFCKQKLWVYQPLILDTLLAVIWIIATASVAAVGSNYGAFSCNESLRFCSLMKAHYAMVVVEMALTLAIFGMTLSFTLRWRKNRLSSIEH